MAHHLRAKAALLEYLGAVASIHMEAHKQSRGSDTFLRHIPTSRQNTQMRKKTITICFYNKWHALNLPLDQVDRLPSSCNAKTVCECLWWLLRPSGMLHECKGASLPSPFLLVSILFPNHSQPSFWKSAFFQTEENMKLIFLSLFYFNSFYFIRNIVQLIELCAWKKIEVSCDAKVHRCLGARSLWVDSCPLKTWSGMKCISSWWIPA